MKRDFSNGNRTEWSPIRPVIIRVTTKSNDRAAGVRFVNNEYNYRPNCKDLKSYYQLRRVFSELRALRRQKYYNNLLPLVRFGLNLVCSAPGYDIDGRFDCFDSSAVPFAHV